MSRMTLATACERWLKDFGIGQDEIKAEAKSLADYLTANVPTMTDGHREYMRNYMARRRLAARLGVKVTLSPKGRN